ncbi:hypothetical protein QBC45DRAFT_443922 [Copromyces sp. CBS 386.78]|nr:hypothetical protein QBC45DRAFT_443922 [Copromyces sp. CBS 386.78]
MVTAESLQAVPYHDETKPAHQQEAQMTTPQAAEKKRKISKREKDQERISAFRSRERFIINHFVLNSRRRDPRSREGSQPAATVARATATNGYDCAAPAAGSAATACLPYQHAKKPCKATPEWWAWKFFAA